MKWKTIAILPFAVVFLIHSYAFTGGLSPALQVHYDELRREIYGGYLCTRNYRNLRFYVAACLHDLSSLEWRACDAYERRYGQDCNANVTRELYNLARFLFTLALAEREAFDHSIDHLFQES